MGTDAVRVVLAADDNYAIPLAVTGRSIARTLGTERDLVIYVLDNAISPDNRAKIVNTLEPRADVVWLENVGDTLANMPTYGFFTPAAYSRLLIPELLPPDIDRVIYLDTDTMIRHDIAPLFDSSLGDQAALAVPDMGAAFVSSPWGLALWYSNGRSAGEFNFNSGVMLINLDLWRREHLGRAAMEYMRDGRHQYNLDQEAINAVMGTRIGAIDPTWNQQGELYDRPCELALPYSSEMIAKLKTDPSIIHFSSVDKPWHYGSSHPFAQEWMDVVDDTAFAGWRPKRPSVPVRIATGVETLGRKSAGVFRLGIGGMKERWT